MAICPPGSGGRNCRYRQHVPPSGSGFWFDWAHSLAWLFYWCVQGRLFTVSEDAWVAAEWYHGRYRSEKICDLACGLAWVFGDDIYGECYFLCLSFWLSDFSTYSGARAYCSGVGGWSFAESKCCVPAFRFEFF